MSLALLHERTDAVFRVIENTAAVLAGAATLLAMCLVSADALMRYLFAAPLTFQLHFTSSYLMVALFMLALPWGFRTGGFIRTTGLTDRLPPVAGEALLRAGLLASAVFMAFLTWRNLLKFHHAWVRNEVVMGVVDWPVAWSLAAIPVGAGLLTARLLLEASTPKPLRGLA